MSEIPSIRWRPELQSFLPPIEAHGLRKLLRQEIQRHLRAVRQGKILSHKEHWDRFIVEDRDPQGRKVWRPRPEAKGFMRYFESFGLIDQRLRERYGRWIPPLLSNSTLSPLLHPVPGRGGTTRSSPQHAVEVMVERVIALHGHTDRYLRDLHERFDLRDAEAREDALVDASRYVAQQLGQSEGHDDRWFHDVGRRVALLLESIGCPVTHDEVDVLSDRHFSSWIEPKPSALDAYATEVALLGIERLFEERYGESE